MRFIQTYNKNIKISALDTPDYLRDKFLRGQEQKRQQKAYFEARATEKEEHEIQHRYALQRIDEMAEEIDHLKMALFDLGTINEEGLQKYD